MDVFELGKAKLDENDKAYYEYIGTGLTQLPGPKRPKLDAESDDEDQQKPGTTEKETPVVPDVEPKSVDAFSNDVDGSGSIENYESAKEELEDEVENEPRKKKKVMIEDEEEENEVVADSQEPQQLCYETDLSDELDESYDTDIDITPVEVARELADIEGEEDLGESARQTPDMFEKIPVELDTQLQALLQEPMKHEFTPPRLDRSPNNGVEPSQEDVFQTPVASSRRQSVITSPSGEKLEDTTRIDHGDVSSQSQCLKIEDNLQKLLKLADKPRPETSLLDEYALQSTSTLNKSGPLHENVTERPKEDIKPKKKYVEFEVNVYTEDGSLRKFTYEELLQKNHREWFSGEDPVSFKPDFLKPDYSYQTNHIYCPIPGYELGTVLIDHNHPTLPKKFPQPWKQRNVEKSRIKQKQRRMWLKEFKNNYLTGGYQLFVSLLEMFLGIDTNMPALEKYYHEEREKTSEEAVLEKFRSVVQWALKAQNLFDSIDAIFFLSEHIESATFSQEQCAALVSWMFLFKISERLNFVQILIGNEQIHVEKLRFMFTYFEASLSIPPGGTVSFRRVRNTLPRTDAMYDTHADFNVKILDCDLKIEETALCTQVDFANKFIGGGVLRSGCVQEEIRFLMCPEMMVAMMITEPMSNNEAISIVGAQAYSSYSGYGNTTKWEPLNERDIRQNDPSYRDHYGRLRVETIAIDAIDFTTSGRPLLPLRTQLTDSNINREFRKAVAGFSSQGSDFKPPIVSGWWGCGAFSGHKPLKVLIQACAAAKSGRELWICKFGDDDMAQKTKRMFERFKQVNLTPGQIMRLLLSLDRPNQPSDTFVYDALATLIASPSFEAPIHYASSHSES